LLFIKLIGKYLIIANIIKLLRVKLPLIYCSKGFFLKDVVYLQHLKGLNLWENL